MAKYFLRTVTTTPFESQRCNTSLYIDHEETVIIFRVIRLRQKNKTFKFGIFCKKISLRVHKQMMVVLCNDNLSNDDLEFDGFFVFIQ